VYDCLRFLRNNGTKNGTDAGGQAARDKKSSGERMGAVRWGWVSAVLVICYAAVLI
jgi:hypothetical protein